jgi:predicted methyltransferase
VPSICQLIREAAHHGSPSGNFGRPDLGAPNDEHLVPERSDLGLPRSGAATRRGAAGAAAMSSTATRRRFHIVTSTLILSAVGVTIGQAPAANSTASFIASAVADSERPEGDRKRDAARKPAESLQFSGIRPGDVVGDYNARGGYFTRLFANVVGTRGHVYAVEPVETLQYVRGDADGLQTYVLHQPNVTILIATALEGLRFPRKLDLFWISQNYHDLYNKNFGPVDIAAFNKAVLDALKPGGIYIVLDHSAATGASANVTETLDRIDPATVRRDVEAAGFQFVGESTILANPADSRSVNVFDSSIQGNTDQFILKFRKP